jgi:hypothetical protein
MSKIETQIITVYSDGSIHVQNLHKATTVAVAEDEPGDQLPPDPNGGNNPPPPKDP